MIKELSKEELRLVRGGLGKDGGPGGGPSRDDKIIAIGGDPDAVNSHVPDQAPVYFVPRRFEEG